MRRVEGNLNQRVSSLQEENGRLVKELGTIKESIAPIRKSQADAGADLIDVRDQIQTLKGAVEEIKRDLNTLKTERKDRDTRDTQQDTRLNDLQFRISFLENLMGVGKAGATEDDGKKDSKPAAAAPNGKPDYEGIYNAAYKEFKDGKNDEARRDFQKFLETYPNVEYSSNAQFWIGECYYVEGKYEKAILEYEKVIKNFAGSDKVPSALLKQGLSFLKLKDTASAKLILQQVIKDHPNTNQARIARARLAEIK